MTLFYAHFDKDAREQAAMRVFLIGTAQGAKLSMLRKKLKRGNIFKEKVDPTNETFQSNYYSILKLLRTFNPSVLKMYLLPVVEAIMFLLRLKFFQNDSVPVS
jgi:hypothetical protein